MVKPDGELFDIELVASSLDLKAGQLVDRVGVMLNCEFPCGPQIERLALNNTELIKIKPTMKGVNCCLSGVQNKCAKLLSDGKNPEYIAALCLESIKSALFSMAEELIKIYGNLPLIFAGGVMSNSIIRAQVEAEFGAFFAKPQFSSDNAAGIAILASFRS